LLRHGKAENLDPARLGDFFRPLASEGSAKIKGVGQKYSSLIQAPVRVVASSALRTKQTAEIFCEAAGVPIAEFFDQLYHASSEDWLQLVRQTSGSCNTLILVGHNPTLSELASQLAGQGIELETGGTAFFKNNEKTGWESASGWYHVAL